MTRSTSKQPQLITEKDAARMLSISERTLRNWRTRGGGPRFVRVSARCIRYRISDIEDWAAERTRRNTSDLGLSPFEL